MASTNTQSLVLYCELLSNIRQVSVVATLPSAPDATTKAELVDHGRLFQVHHQDRTETVVLPATVSSTTAVTVSPHKSSTLSWRFPVRSPEARPAQFSPESQALPWSAVDIKHDTSIACRRCNQIIVDRGRIGTWKDLPSENWAEMMEFWHCHKPHDHDHGHDHTQDGETLANSKGYGANNAISAQVGVGFVDLASFMFSEPDCRNLTVSGRFLAVFFSSRLLYAPMLDQGKKKVAMSANSCQSVTWKPIQIPKNDPSPRHLVVASRLGPFSYGNGTDPAVLVNETSNSIRTSTAAEARGIYEAHAHGVSCVPNSAAYSAQFSSTAKPGQDAGALVVDASTPTKFLRVCCKSCATEIGFFNVAISSINLFKWQVDCETTLPSRSPTGPECLAASLIAIISQSGSAKVVVTPHASASQGKKGADLPHSLHLWVLNSNVVYTSSQSRGRRTAMKILYRDVSTEKAFDMLESLNSDVQEIGWPPAAIEHARAALEASSSLLPAHERNFREWNVGLLQRWDASEVASSLPDTS